MSTRNRPAPRPAPRSVGRTTPSGDRRSTEPIEKSNDSDKPSPRPVARPATRPARPSGRSTDRTEKVDEPAKPSDRVPGRSNDRSTNRPGTRSGATVTSSSRTPVTRARPGQKSTTPTVESDSNGLVDLFSDEEVRVPIEYTGTGAGTGSGSGPGLVDLESDSGSDDRKSGKLDVSREQAKHLQPPEIPKDMRVGIPVRNIRTTTVVSSKGTKLDDLALEAPLVKPMRPSQIIPRKSTSRLR